MAALDRLAELEAFLMSLQPEQTFRPNRLWRLPFLGLHDYVLPQTIDEWFGGLATLAPQLATAPVELVVVATDVTDDDVDRVGRLRARLLVADDAAGRCSRRRSSPRPRSRRSCCRCGSATASRPTARGCATTRSGYAYDHDEVELIVAFRYLPRIRASASRRSSRCAGGSSASRASRRCGRSSRRSTQAEARAARGEPAHLADMLVRLARVAILRNTQLEERTRRASGPVAARAALAAPRRARRSSTTTRSARPIDARFAEARFPFRHDRFIPRFTVHGSIDGAGLDRGCERSRGGRPTRSGC